MEYIILDNEWITTYYKIGSRSFNELIEIGAVKLDENLNEISRFTALIRSTFTKKLSSRFQRLTNITTEEMQKNGMTFDQAVDLYTEWAGNDAVTMTWSNSDLYVLLDNFKLRRNLGSVPFIGMYADLQKYAQSEMIATGHTITSQISVANAALSLAIPIDGIGLHRALDDSLLCAEILRKVFNKKRFNNFVIPWTLVSLMSVRMARRSHGGKCKKSQCDASETAGKFLNGGDLTAQGGGALMVEVVGLVGGGFKGVFDGGAGGAADECAGDDGAAGAVVPLGLDSVGARCRVELVDDKAVADDLAGQYVALAVVGPCAGIVHVAADDAVVVASAAELYPEDDGIVGYVAVKLDGAVGVSRRLALIPWT